MNEPIHIISLGAGVQSSTMALMAARGEITPMPECAIFADTGDEPPEVYAWLKELCRMLTFAVIVLKGPKLSESIVNQWGHSQIPAWFAGKNGPAIGRRQCTKYFKVLPVRHEIRRRFPRRDCAEQFVRDGVPCFFKQDSAAKPGQRGRIPDHIWELKQFPAPHSEAH